MRRLMREESKGQAEKLVPNWAQPPQTPGAPGMGTKMRAAALRAAVRLGVGEGREEGEGEGRIDGVGDGVAWDEGVI